MCGIIAAFNKEGNVNEWVVNQYEEQYERGQKGFGLVFIDKDKTFKTLRACEPAKALLDLYLNESEAIVMHHRTPTSSANYLDQTHPITVSDGSLKYDYMVVHNGVISNDDLLKKTHEELGFVYNTAYEIIDGGRSKYNDSECLAIEVARFIEDQTTEIGIQGSAAFVALQVSKKGADKGKVIRAYFGKNEGSPLNLSASNKKIRISSEGEGESVKPFVLYSFEPGKFNFDKEKMPFKAIVDKDEKPMGFAGVYSRNKAPVTYDYYEDYVPRNLATETPTDPNDVVATERAEIISDCQAKVNMALENFLSDLKENNPVYQPEAGSAVAEISEALFEAQQRQEMLMCNEDISLSAGTKIDEE